MRAGDQVIYLRDPYEHGTGTIMRAGPDGWLWVEFVDGHYDQYSPHVLELDDLWEHEQVQRLTPAKFLGGGTVSAGRSTVELGLVQYPGGGSALERDAMTDETYHHTAEQLARAAQSMGVWLMGTTADETEEG